MRSHPSLPHYPIPFVPFRHQPIPGRHPLGRHSWRASALLGASGLAFAASLFLRPRSSRSVSDSQRNGHPACRPEKKSAAGTCRWTYHFSLKN
eukprot:scaffold4641_cov117-Isochrysis_galbana.AAC.19